MSLSRYFTAPLEGLRHLPTLYDQDFGLGMSLHELLDSTIGHLRSGYLGPSRQVVKSNVKVDKDTFEVMIDVQQFAPDEIFVKTVENEVIVEGKHEEKKDEQGYISRNFVRRYKIPEGVKVDAITSFLSSDGVLTIKAPKARPVEEGNVRHVPIKMTGSPAVSNSHPPMVSHAAHHASHAHMDSLWNHVPHPSKVHHTTYPHHGSQATAEGPHSHPGSQDAHKASHEHQNAQENQSPLAIKATAANPNKGPKK